MADTSINRLKELRKAAHSGNNMDEKYGSDIKLDVIKDKTDQVDSELAKHTKLYDPIRDGIVRIQSRIKEIEGLQSQNATAVDENERKELMDQLDKITELTGKESKEMKEILDDIRNSNLKFESKEENRNSALAQARTNLYQVYLRKFHQVMNQYQQVAHDFKKAIKERARRLLRILDSNLNDDQMDAILEQEVDPATIIISDDLDNAVREIQDRYVGVRKLNRQVKEIAALFNDLATLVELQQEKLDVIENRVKNAKNYGQVAEKELRKAEDDQMKSKRRTCYIFIISAVILAILMLFLFGTGSA